MNINTINKAIEKANKYTISDTINQGITQANINPNSVIHICENLTGKMVGMHSVTTNAMLNPNCLARMKNDKMTCSHCYTANALTTYDNFIKQAVYNSYVLSHKVLNYDELPTITDLYFRLESHGDIINVTQAVNYILLAIKNDKTTFTLWTKNPNYIVAALKEMETEKPQNLRVIYSSPYLNDVDSKMVEKFKHILNGVFTVFTAQFAIDNNININCGSKICRACLQCYQENDEFIYINEILKQELTKFLRLGGTVQ